MSEEAEKELAVAPMEPRQPITPEMEAQIQSEIIRLARANGQRIYITQPNKKVNEMMQSLKLHERLKWHRKINQGLLYDELVKLNKMVSKFHEPAELDD